MVVRTAEEIARGRRSEALHPREAAAFLRPLTSERSVWRTATTAASLKAESISLATAVRWLPMFTTALDSRIAACNRQPLSREPLDLAEHSPLFEIGRASCRERVEI